MKICYVNPTNNIRRPIAELSNILTNKDYQISIMFPQSSNCPTKNWVANESINNSAIKKITIRSRYFAPLRYNFPQLLYLWRETKKIYQENDYVHIWEYYYPISTIPLLYAAFSKERRRKTILTTDGFVGYSYKPKEPWWLVPAFKLYTKLFARFLFKIPTVITTYGDSMLPFAKKALVPLSKLKVIPTGIHIDRFQKVKAIDLRQLRAEFSIQNEKIILFVGMLTERKGIKTVIEVSQQLLEEGLNIKTIIVGDAHGDNTYTQLVNPKFKDKIIFAGGRKDIPELMHLADVLLLPSEGEGLPGVVMEAMASGLPVVATYEGCTPDLIENGEEGLLVNNGDYYSPIKKVIIDEKLKFEMSLKTKIKIKLFSWKNVYQKYEELYSPHY
ncbi:glycosyltransferase family 4 protein [Candidatus Woesearchaeota archaeon]|nr:hypothetical protein [uncultured archaeon]MBS3124398.1 glycosyltransferase family 4 protein [Candidatus Woesearchaeota archaeon]